MTSYFRPEWTCGRYNSRHRVALMYNLLEGVAHFFDDLSADVVSIILNTPINEQYYVKNLKTLWHTATYVYNSPLRGTLQHLADDIENS